jgi:cytochrome c biogenesis protein CcmG, thiol:disulfide interchange protein DsbE
VTEKVMAETILPRVEKLRNEASGAGTAEAPR